MTSTERRTNPRWDAQGAVVAWMFARHGAPERCRVVDASRNGVLLETSLPLPRGAKIQLAFARKRDLKVTRLFRSWAQVARRTTGGIAVFFVSPPRNANNQKRKILF